VRLLKWTLYDVLKEFREVGLLSTVTNNQNRFRPLEVVFCLC